MYKYKTGLYSNKIDLAMAAEILTQDIDEIDALIESDEVKVLKDKVPKGYNPRIHTLHVKGGKETKTTFTFAIGYKVTKVLIKRKNNSVILNSSSGNALPVPSIIAPLVDIYWIEKDGTYVPGDLSKFKDKLKKYAISLIEEKRKSIIDKSDSGDLERDYWPSIAEASIRIKNDKPFEFDMSLFEAEANAMGDGTTPDQLVNIVYEKTKSYLLAGRVLQGLQKYLEIEFDSLDENSSYDDMLKSIDSLITRTDKTFESMLSGS